MRALLAQQDWLVDELEKRKKETLDLRREFEQVAEDNSKLKAEVSTLHQHSVLSLQQMNTLALNTISFQNAAIRPMQPPQNQQYQQNQLHQLQVNVDNAPENVDSDLEDEWDYEDEDDVIAELDAAIRVNDRHRDRHDEELLMRYLRKILNTRRYHGNTDFIKKLLEASYGTGNPHRHQWWSTEFVKEFWDDFHQDEFTRLKRQVSNEKQRARG